MKKYLIYFVVGFFLYGELIGQNCPVQVNSCSSAVLIGDCTKGRQDVGVTSPGPFPGCPSNVIDNPIWYQFDVLSQGIIDVLIDQSNCDNFSGMQSALYTGCLPSDLVLSIQCGCTTGIITHTAFLPPGTYYLLLDGCAGDLCDYTISITGDIGDVPVSINTPPTATDMFVCPFQEVTFFAGDYSGGSDVMWNFPSGVTPISPPPYCETITVIWGDRSGEVSYTVADGCGGSVEESEAISITILELSGQDFGAYCASDPNEFGWFHAGTGLEIPCTLPGDPFEVTITTAQGCDSIVSIEVECFFSSDEFIVEKLCDGGPSSVEVFGVVYDRTIDTVIVIPNGSSNLLCDSTIYLTLFDLADMPIRRTQNNCDGITDRIILSTDDLDFVTYEWTTVNGIIETDPTQSTIEVSTAGTYFLNVFSLDANNQIDCSGSSTVVVDASDFNPVDISLITSSATCFDNSDGSATVQLVPDLDGYTYDWSSGNRNTQTINNLGVGTYEVTVKSSGGCSDTFSFVIDQPDFLRIELITDGVVCDNDGAIEVNVSGGTAPYIYNWQTGETASTITNLSAGNYVVTVTDANGCSRISNTTLIPDVDFEVEATPAACDTTGGMITVTSISGTINPIFDWSNGANGPVLNNVQPGFYSVTLTDNDSGCESVKSIDVLVEQDCFIEISGFVYDDQENSDCLIDVTSIPVAGVTVRLDNGQTVNTNANGFYNFTVRPGVYEVSIEIDSVGIEPICTGPLVVDAVFFTTIPYSDNNFYVKGNAEVDLGVKAGKGDPSPDQINIVRILVANTGDEPASGTLSFVHDELQSFEGSSIPSFAYDASTREVVWTFRNFRPGRTYVFNAYMKTNANAPIGATINHDFEVVADQLEINLLNNTFSCQSTVVDANNAIVAPISVEDQIAKANTALGLDQIKVDVFPNPFSQQTTLELDAYLESPIRIELFDYQGKQLRVDQFEGQQYQLSREGLPAGIYFYRLSAAGLMIKTGRIIIQ